MLLGSELQTPPPGAVLGPWRVLARAGSGGNGIVYRVCRAEDPEVGPYALKLAREPESPRFEREAELLSRLNHPNVPRLLDRGLWKSPWGGEYPYLVMEWVEGVPLYRWAAEGGLTSRRALLVLAQVARALEAIHRHGLHRDVKGDNVLVTPYGHAMLVDYGSCWYEGARPLTTSAVPPGTPPYRSPECLRFQYRFRNDPEAHYPYSREDDLYALGVMSYRLVTGTYPSRGVDPEFPEGDERSLAPRLVPPSERVVLMPALEALIMRLLSEKREERGTAGEIAEAMIEAVKSTRREEDRPIKPLLPRLIMEKRAEPGGRNWPGTRRKPRWSVLAGVIAAVALARQLASFQEPPHQAEAEKASEEEADERTVGVADAGVEGLASVVSAPRVGAPVYALAMPMPKKPFPGQNRPPCEAEGQKSINGGCWVGPIGTKKPPCGKAGFDHDDGCYLPVFMPGAPNTSELP
jgi:predicted Ser/Thr protein kinase